MKKVMTVIGTRPEGIKMAPILHAFEQDTTIQSVFVNTGQHAELLDQVLELFQLTPDYQLGLMREGQSLATLSERMIGSLSEVMKLENPDIVLVHGDTTTTFIACYTAFLHGIPVGHVEAGLRTYNLSSPFPEEANRQLTGRLASYHFAATEANRENLLQEGIDEKRIFVVGNSVIDALKSVVEQKEAISDDIQTHFSRPFKTILMTTHRRENLEQLSGIYEGALALLDTHPDTQLLFPVHKNPVVLRQAEEWLGHHPRVHLIDPLSYADFSYAMKESHFIITDSGGIQEEAPTFGTPVLVARDTTERGEGVEAGTLRLIGTGKENLLKEGNRLLTDNAYYQSFANIANPYGDGKTSERIRSILHEQLSF